MSRAQDIGEFVAWTGEALLSDLEAARFARAAHCLTSNAIVGRLIMQELPPSHFKGLQRFETHRLRSQHS
jgi:hypothetical protein